jgi:proteasome lid subunit RPN8/RPN11
MMLIASALLARIHAAAEAAYPHECCGLLVGRRRADGTVVVSELAPSANVAAGGGRDRFEVDPALRFALMRRLAGSAETIVGHYHSHPDHGAWPSPQDVAMAFEPELVWLITAVTAGRATGSAAFRIGGPGAAVEPLDLRPYNEQR